MDRRSVVQRKSGTSLTLDTSIHQHSQSADAPRSSLQIASAKLVQTSQLSADVLLLTLVALDSLDEPALCPSKWGAFFDTPKPAKRPWWRVLLGNAPCIAAGALIGSAVPYVGMLAERYVFFFGSRAPLGGWVPELGRRSCFFGGDLPSRTASQPVRFEDEERR